MCVERIGDSGMTENEAKEIIKNFPNWNLDDQWLEEEEMQELSDLLISVLSEIQQYRSIGTVEEIESLNFSSNQLRLVNLVERYKEKLKEYEEIGTVSECLDAMEKQRVKKPIRNDMCTCPKCGTHNEVVKKHRNTVNQDTVYCWYCGQAMEVKRGDTP